MYKKIITLVAVSATFFTQAQKFGAELNYGLATAKNKVKSDSKFNHIGLGFSYDINDYFSTKLDFGIENFSYENSNNNVISESGTKSTRISLQGVYNFSKLTDSNRFSTERFNLLVHAGAGVTLLNSDLYEGNDTSGNIIIGLTPRYPLAKNLFITFDASVIFNIKQNFGFNGEYFYPNTNQTFAGQMYNLSLGLQYKFGN